MEERCDTCRFWERYRFEDRQANRGDCRRNAPIPVFLAPSALFDSYNKEGRKDRRGLWPWTKEHEWCGQWEEKADMEIDMKYANSATTDQNTVSADDAGEYGH